MGKRPRNRRPEPQRPASPATKPPAAPSATIEPATPTTALDGNGRARDLAPVRRARAPLRPHVLGAVFARNFSGYFSNPAGYVFITLFVLVCSWAEFWQPSFFANNLANLDPLNQWMPYLLLFFVPAITMVAWAEERRQGTEELLLTLPARDVEVVLGKYLAALGIYSAALAFLAVGHGAILRYLGHPDWGILLATFLGYWLMGALLIAIGLVASMLSANVTVAFILGALFCAVPVFLGQVGSIGPDPVRRAIEDLSVPMQFRDFGTGVVTLSGVIYFLSLAAAMLYLNMVLLGRRHWAGGQASAGRWVHATARVLAVIAALVSLDALVGHLGSRLRADVTEEQLHNLSPVSRQIIRGIPPERPVFIQAFYSPEVPRQFIQTKIDLLDKLREIAALGGNKVRLNLVETPRYSQAARDAEKRFGITARRVPTNEAGRQGFEEFYLGVAFTSGLQEVVVPFFDRGLPIEYELVRSIRVVTGAKRKRVGILNTDAKLTGGFDPRSFSQESEWQIVTELKKQYDITTVAPDTPIPSDLDALIVAQPSSLSQPQIDNLTAYVRKGGPTLLLLDPFVRTVGDPSLNPTEPKTPAGGMMGGPPPTPKGDLQPLLDLIGLDWPNTDVVWNPYRPHRQFDLPDLEILFVGHGMGRDAFANDPISAGLQELVFLFGGSLRGKPGATTEFAPLIRTDDKGGVIPYPELVTRGFMGTSTLNPRRFYDRSGRAYTLAARITGKLPAEPAPAADAAKKDAARKDAARPAQAHVIAIADLDMISDMFFEIRRRPVEQYDFLDLDNVTFVLNCVDVLAGDTSFLDVRKKRPHHRTLETVEAKTDKFVRDTLDAEKKAKDKAKSQLDQAQKRLSDAVEAIRKSKEYDERTREATIELKRQDEERRLTVQRAAIEDEERQANLEAKAREEREIQAVQNQIRYAAIALPPLPALLLGIVVFLARASRENRGASPNRLA